MFSTLVTTSIAVLITTSPGGNITSNCSAVALFSYAGQEYRKTFTQSNRTFSFAPRLPRDVVIHQRYKEKGAGLGSAAWDGSVVLADVLAQSRVDCLDIASLVRGRRVLEIGAGVGLVATVALLLNASAVVATDGDAAVLPLIRKNYEANGVGGSGATAEVLRWGKAETRAAAVRLGWSEPFDIILLADVVYEADGKKASAAAGVVRSTEEEESGVAATGDAAEHSTASAASTTSSTPNAHSTLQIHGSGHAFRALAETLVELADRNADVFLSYKRRYGRERAFFTQIAKYFKKRRLPRRCLHPDFRSSGIDVFHLKRRRSE